MAFTYDISTTRGKVRFRVGDTDSNDPLLTDAEVDFVLDDSNDDFLVASVKACRAIVAKLAREVNASAAGINSSRQSKFEQYRKLLEDLEADVVSSGAASTYVGGISKDREQTADEDTDLRPNAFSVGMHDTTTDDDPTVSGA